MLAYIRHYYLNSKLHDMHVMLSYTKFKNENKFNNGYTRLKHQIKKTKKLFL